MTPKPTPAGPDVLVITAHPQMQDSRVNRRLMKRAREAATQTSASRIVVRDLYALYPDYLIDVIFSGATRSAQAAGRTSITTRSRATAIGAIDSIATGTTSITTGTACSTTCATCSATASYSHSKVF